MVVITEDISLGKEKVKVSVVNELDDSIPTEFGVICYVYHSY